MNTEMTNAITTSTVELATSRLGEEAELLSFTLDGREHTELRIEGGIFTLSPETARQIANWLLTWAEVEDAHQPGAKS